MRRKGFHGTVMQACNSVRVGARPCADPHRCHRFGAVMRILQSPPGFIHSTLHTPGRLDLQARSVDKLPVSIKAVSH